VRELEQLSETLDRECRIWADGYRTGKRMGVALGFFLAAVAFWVGGVIAALVRLSL
jgi:hypothetical protein